LLTILDMDSQKERDHYEDQEVGGWIILRWILGWCGLVRLESEEWRALVNAVMPFRFHKIM
jgi:hypothetical protein